MADLFDYISWRGDLDFEFSPFNKIDALLLAHLSYVIYDGIVTDDFSIQKTFLQVDAEIKNSADYEERKNIGLVINPRSMDLFSAAAKSNRFKDIKICGFRNIFNMEKSEQFAAITFLFDNKNCDKIVISFRGTDDSICGWHEDFNLAVMPEIPSQKDAINYFNDAAEFFFGKKSSKKFKSNKLIILGHSKGGNLAVNTAVSAGVLQSKIEKVYNFDGPGFSKDFFRRDDYKKIAGKIYSVYPEGSIIGMIFNHEGEYEIAKSSAKAIMQHDAMTWQILGCEFVTADDFNEQSNFFNKVFNRWIDELNTEQKKEVVHSLFSVIDATGAKYLKMLAKDSFGSSAKMIAKLAELPKEEKREVREVLKMIKSAIAAEYPLFKAV